MSTKTFINNEDNLALTRIAYGGKTPCIRRIPGQNVKTTLIKTSVKVKGKDTYLLLVSCSSLPPGVAACLCGLRAVAHSEFTAMCLT